MIPINLNTVLYTHVEVSPTKAIYIIYIFREKKENYPSICRREVVGFCFDLKRRVKTNG